MQSNGLKGRLSMSAKVRTYNMYPQKTYGGHVEARVMHDGRIHYSIYMLGTDQACDLIVDPSNENEMRGVRQLHLVQR
jgi:hypothetical protein